MRLRYLALGAVLASLLLTLRFETTGGLDFDLDVEHAALHAQAAADGSRCPLSDAELRRMPAWLLAACASGGLAWHEAAMRYPADAENAFRVYRGEPEFADLFDRLGHPSIPVIAYFVRNGSTLYRVNETVGQGLSRLWNEGRLGFGPAELTPEQYGLIAIHELDRRGHEMLSEFEIVDGVAVRKPLTRTLLGAKNLFFGGVVELESVLARGERLPSWGEVGWAALDVAIVTGGVGAAAKVVRVGRAPAAAMARGAHLRAAGVGAARSLATVGKAAGVAAAIAVPYVAVTRPHLFASAGGWLAEQAGLPRWAGVFAAYAMLAMVAAWLIGLVIRPLRPILRLVRRVFAQPRTAAEAA